MTNKIKYRYNSLEDFLISNLLSVDGQLDDGGGAMFPVKGREIEATILFADISSFSKKTYELSPTEILIFVNNFFTWITAEALREWSGIIDKYIGDEIMVIFSEEFGSEDSFTDAIQTARWMTEKDVLNFRPRIGIASGLVTVGFVGTPLKYNCSVFGLPVTIAKRCASVESQIHSQASIVFPANLWTGRSFEKIFTPVKQKRTDGSIVENPHSWELFPPRKVQMKNMPEIEIMEIANQLRWKPNFSTTERTKEMFRLLYEAGMYKPKNIESKD